MNLVCENLPCLAPAGNSQPDSELILWIISVTIWIALLSFSIILVNKAKGDLRDWILAFPFFSGFIGIGTMGLSVILAIFFVPSGEVGRWTENFHEQYASLSVLAYYKPMRFLIPVGFTIVSFGILISLVEGLRKWWIHSRKTGFIQSFLLVSWSITVLLGIFFVESTLLFTRDIDREIHLNMVAASHICLTLSPFLCSTFLLLQTKSENKSSDFQTRLLTISVGIIIIALFTYLIHMQEILSIGFMSFSHQIMIGSQLVWLIYFSTIFFE
ncbi:MAG: hypothetical protein CL993_01065 [Euryarchaeota archaeon]|nr:hypothetical protein [Euryarchaeota archaeon]